MSELSETYDRLCEQNQRKLQEISSSIQVSNFVRLDDGTYGEGIRMTRKQLLNLLAEAYLEGYSDH